MSLKIKISLGRQLKPILGLPQEPFSWQVPQIAPASPVFTKPICSATFDSLSWLFLYCLACISLPYRGMKLYFRAASQLSWTDKWWLQCREHRDSSCTRQSIPLRAEFSFLLTMAGSTITSSCLQWLGSWFYRLNIDNMNFVIKNSMQLLNEWNWYGIGKGSVNTS